MKLHRWLTAVFAILAFGGCAADISESARRLTRVLRTAVANVAPPTLVEVAVD